MPMQASPLKLSGSHTYEGLTGKGDVIWEEEGFSDRRGDETKEESGKDYKSL